MKFERATFIVVIFVFLILAFGCSTSGESTLTISPNIRFEGNWLYIKNTNHMSYDAPKIALNDGQFKLDYPMSIPSREEIRINLSSFLKPDGERFNILKYGLVDISISCECSREMGGKWEKLGKAFWYGKFK
jgi:hypothetical protein